MNFLIFERVRTNLFGGHHPNAFEPLLRDRTAVRGPLQGTPEEFSQALYELTGGDLAKRNETVAYEAAAKGGKDMLRFREGARFRVVKARSALGGVLIVLTPHQPSGDDAREAREMPLARLVNDVLMIREPFMHVVNEYLREERKQAADRAAAEIRMARESRLEAVLETIEAAKSGQTIMVRGMQNIEALVELGFIPSIVDNPENWIDAEEHPGLRYRHAKSGVELLLTARERFRPIEELSKLEFTFLVHRSDGDRAAFEQMARKFRGARHAGVPYGMKEFHADLLALVKYPEELKGRTEEDLGLMADEVEGVIDRRQELDKGILPYEAVFRRDSLTIIEHIRRSRLPFIEVRKALDYFEYTGMIDAAYKDQLLRQIDAAAAAQAGVAEDLREVMYDKRVKEIVADVLRRVPKERLTSRTITIALTPYVQELGFGKLIRIRERILQLKDMVHEQGR